MSTKTSRPLRILLVDDHEVVRAGLRTLLAQFPDLEIVGDADSGAAATAEAAVLKPDVVLLDIRLPDESGVEACRKILQTSPETRVLILTSYPEEETVFDALAAGAAGYLLKEIDSAGLVRAIRTVACGQSILDPAITGRVLHRLTHKEPSANAGNLLHLLSPQEVRVLALVTEGKTNKEIGGVLELSDKTVKNYLSNVLEKLGMTRRSQAAAYYVKHQPS